MYREKDLSNNSVGYSSLPDFCVVSSLRGVVTRPHVLNHAGISDISFIYRTVGSGGRLAEKF